MPVVYASIAFHLRAAHMSFFRAQEGGRGKERKKGRENIVLIRHAHRIPASFGRPNKCTHNNTAHIRRKDKEEKNAESKPGGGGGVGVGVGVGGGRFSQSSITITIINVQTSPNV